MAAGIFGFGAFQGVLWWMTMNMATSAAVGLKVTAMGFDRSGNSKYFPTVLAAATADMFSNIMSYMLFWIMFYNIVYVV